MPEKKRSHYQCPPLLNKSLLAVWRLCNLFNPIILSGISWKASPVAKSLLFVWKRVYECLRQTAMTGLIDFIEIFVTNFVNYTLAPNILKQIFKK